MLGKAHTVNQVGGKCTTSQPRLSIEAVRERNVWPGSRLHEPIAQPARNG